MKKRLVLLSMIITILLVLLAFTSCNSAEDPKEVENDGIFTYSLLNDGTYSIALLETYRQIDLGSGNIQTGTQYLELLGEKIELPSTYRGKAVTQIADCGFMGARMQAIILPDTITYIGKNAFYGMDFVDEIQLPDSVKIIGDHALDLGTAVEKKLVLPSSVEYLGASALGQNVIVLYMGTLEEFHQIKNADWGDDFDGNQYDVNYTEIPYIPPAYEKWYVHVEEFSAKTVSSLDYSPYVPARNIITGIWHRTSVVSFHLEFNWSHLFDGTTYTYTQSEVTITDENWQVLKDAEAAGMLATLLNAEETALFNQSEGKDDFSQKLETHCANLYNGKSITFENGIMTIYQNDVQISDPAPYVELNFEAYTRVDGNYVEVFSHITGNPLEESKTSYGTIKHYYTLSEE